METCLTMCSQTANVVGFDSQYSFLSPGKFPLPLSRIKLPVSKAEDSKTMPRPPVEKHLLASR